MPSFNKEAFLKAQDNRRKGITSFRSLPDGVYICKLSKASLEPKKNDPENSRAQFVWEPIPEQNEFIAEEDSNLSIYQFMDLSTDVGYSILDKQLVTLGLDTEEFADDPNKTLEQILGTVCRIRHVKQNTGFFKDEILTVLESPLGDPAMWVKQ